MANGTVRRTAASGMRPRGLREGAPGEEKRASRTMPSGACCRGP